MPLSASQPQWLSVSVPRSLSASVALGVILSVISSVTLFIHIAALLHCLTNLHRRRTVERSPGSTASFASNKSLWPVFGRLCSSMPSREPLRLRLIDPRCSYCFSSQLLNSGLHNHTNQLCIYRPRAMCHAPRLFSQTLRERSDKPQIPSLERHRPTDPFPTACLPLFSHCRCLTATLFHITRLLLLLLLILNEQCAVRV